MPTKSHYRKWPPFATHDLGTNKKRVESLLEIGEELLRNAKAEDFSQLARGILPSRQMWEEALAPFLNLPPRLSSAITSPLSGVVHMVNRVMSESSSKQYESISRDSSQCSAAFRLTHFTVRMLSTFEFNGHLGFEDFGTLVSSLPLAVQLIEDDLDIEKYNYIAGPLSHELREEYRDIVNDARGIMRNWPSSTQNLKSSHETLASTVLSLWKSQIESLDDTSPAAYRIGEAFAKIADGIDPSQFGYSSEAIGQLCKEIRTSNAIRSASWVAALRHSILSNPAGVRICNEFVADSTGLKVDDETSSGKCEQFWTFLAFTDELKVFKSCPCSTYFYLTRKRLIQWRRCQHNDSYSL